MKNNLTFSFLLAFFATSLFSQSNIQQTLSVNSSGAAADASAQLDVSATDKGMLVPRMTTVQRTAIASPATGLLVFDTTTGGFWFYNGTAWQNLSTPKTLADADNDTKIQVEESPDEDIIRFDLGGTENMVLRKNASGFSRLELFNAMSNTFVGESAGAANTTGFQNTALGKGALMSITSSQNNTAIGFGVLSVTTTGGNNTGVGREALALSTGFQNTAIGNVALTSNTSGSENSALGHRALFSNTTGYQNTAIGRSALEVNTTGGNNVALGMQSLFSNTTGSNNTALGYQSDVLSNNLTNATAIGYNAKVGASNSLVLGGTGADAVNVGVGITTPSSPMHVNAIGNGFAHTAGGIELITYADPNYAPVGAWIGTASDHPLHFFTNFSAAPQTTLLQNGNFGIGTSNPLAKLHVNGSLIATGITDADNDTKIQVEETADEDIIRFDLGGSENMVLQKNASGHARLELIDPLDNTFVGKNAGNATTSGDANIAVGSDALKSNTTGFRNLALGPSALFSNTTGGGNIAVGSLALYFNTTAGHNTATGRQALQYTTTGNDNTATGAFALQYNSTGNGNTAMGQEALYLSTEGNNNVAIGVGALSTNTTGSDNTAIGKGADVLSGALTNATVIGYNASVNASNKIRLGNAAVTVIEGQVAYTFPSDARFKFNVKDENVPGLAFINQLRPVTYQFDTRKFDEHLMQNMPDSIQQRRLAGQDYSKSSALVQTGFLAQEVEQVCKKLGYEFSGLHVPESEVDNYGLAYGSFVPLLVKAVQEQQAEIEQLKEENERLKKVEAQLEKITAALAGAGIAVEK